MKPSRVSLPGLLLSLLALAALPACADLTPDNLLLIVNKNAPAGRELAEFYASQRHVPEGRIVEVDLPVVDEITPHQYDEHVVPAVQRFMRENKLDDKVTCLVTFWGVPLRISDRKLSREENFEYSLIQDELKKTIRRMSTLAGQMEGLARSVDPRFVPARDGPGVMPVLTRVDRAGQWVLDHLAGMTDAQRRSEAQTKLDSLTGEFRKPMAPPTSAPAIELTPRQRDPAHLDTLVERRFDPAARAELREIYRQTHGLPEYAQLLEAMLGFLEPKESESALDSELSGLKLGFYNRKQWTDNSLYYKQPRRAGASTMMVMRLDGFQPQRVKQLIIDSIEVERNGLRGKFVIDSRGIELKKVNGQYDGFGYYDQSLRNLAKLVGERSRLTLFADDKAELLPPDSADQVALYCGWYSLRNYVPCCRFVPGAVGYHIASFEMLQLHDSNEPGWVSKMLINGVACTLGPVAEPYLHAFPLPDEFFPVLMTGKLTLAETYWRTCPLASWKMSIVGDPLYRPFGSVPAMSVADIPAPLRGIFSEPGR